MGEERKYKRIDWDAFNELASKSEYSKRQLTKILGHSGNYFQSAKRNVKGMLFDDIEKLAIVFGVDTDDLVIKSPEGEKEEVARETSRVENPQTDSKTNEILRPIEEELEAIRYLLNLIISSNTEKALRGVDPSQTILKRAIIILLNLTGEKGVCLYSDYMKALTVSGIDTKYAKIAMETTGFSLVEKGFKEKAVTYVVGRGSLGGEK